MFLNVSQQAFLVYLSIIFDDVDGSICTVLIILFWKSKFKINPLTDEGTALVLNTLRRRVRKMLDDARFRDADNDGTGPFETSCSKSLN